MREHFDFGSIVVIVVTLVLFTIALFVKGLTHDLLLESAVFLVSVKLVMATYKNSVQIKGLEGRLDEIRALLQRKDRG